jgi:hypothetical protein
MQVAEAQREMRAVFLNGAIGQIVSGAIWLVSAALSTAGNRRLGVLTLVIGGAFIFPITRLVLALMRRRSALGPANPLTGLAMEIAFIVPLTLPLVGGAALHNPSWFYPGCMIVVGAHYLPFIFLYGLWHFGVIAALLLGGGIALGLAAPHAFTTGGWLTGAALVAFGAWLATVKEPRAGAGAPV